MWRARSAAGLLRAQQRHSSTPLALQRCAQRATMSTAAAAANVQRTVPAAVAAAAAAGRLYVPHFQQPPRTAAAGPSAAAAPSASAPAVPVQYLSFFQYVSLPADSLPPLRDEMVAALQSLGARGRIYISVEGINAQMTCPVPRMAALRALVDTLAGGAFAGVEFTLGDTHIEGPLSAAAAAPATHAASNGSGAAESALSDTDEAAATAGAPAASSVSPFTALQVRVKSRLVNDGLDAETHARMRLDDHGEGLDPAQWHAELDALARAPERVHPATAIIDCRNFYESDVGRFDGATPADTQVYTQTFPRLEAILAEREAAAADALLRGLVHPDAPEPFTYIYCTGGIRCVKVGAWLRSKNLGRKVKFLRGGINNYNNFVQQQLSQQQQGSAADTATAAATAAPAFESRFKGLNFVFDSRMESGSASVRVTADVLSQCAQCGTAHDVHVNCRNARCHALFLQCATCAEKMDHTCSDECRDVVRAVVAAAKDSPTGEPSFAGVPQRESYEFRPRITWAARKKQLEEAAAAAPDLAAIETASFNTWCRSHPPSTPCPPDHACAQPKEVPVAPAAAAPAATGAGAPTAAAVSAATAAAPTMPCPHLASYCVSHSTAPQSAQLLHTISARTEAAMPERANMLSDALVGSVLRSLVTAATAGTAAPRLLELGTFTGYSTAWLLDCLPAGRGTLVSCELRDEYAALAQHNLRDHPRLAQLQLLVGPAYGSLQSLIAGGAGTGAVASAFDFIYIDANKKAYASYVDLILREGLLKPTGVMVLDNTLWKGQVLAAAAGASSVAATPDSMTRAMHALNRTLAADPRLIVTLLPVRDGITIVQHRPTHMHRSEATQD